jgi:hypothetical protein
MSILALISASLYDIKEGLAKEEGLEFIVIIIIIIITNTTNCN